MFDKLQFVVDVSELGLELRVIQQILINENDKLKFIGHSNRDLRSLRLLKTVLRKNCLSLCSDNK